MLVPKVSLVPYKILSRKKMVPEKNEPEKYIGHKKMLVPEKK